MYSEWIYKFQNEIRAVLDPLIPEGSSVALLDYPYHTNVGDSLIWLGEIAYLKSRKCKIEIVSTLALDNINLIQIKSKKIDFILLHGGGNFGSIWPQFQVFRERVIKRFTSIPIIQFPQSIFYDSPVDVDAVAELINRHGSTTILVRDYASYELMVPFLGDSVKLCPDMAFMLGPISGSGIKKDQKTFIYLSRTDKEKQHQGVAKYLQTVVNVEVVEDDWLDESLLEQYIIKVEWRIRKFFGRNSYVNKLLLPIWNALSLARKRRGVRKLSLGDIVITDRLHAHILSILLGKKHIVLDNNNKKLSGFYNEWTHHIPGVILVNSTENINYDLSQAIIELSK